MTMTDLQTARTELFRISKFYPTLSGLLMKTVKDGSQQKFGSVWAKTLTDAKLAKDHFCNVCDEYASGEIDMPEPSDRLCREIIKEVRHRMWEEQRKLEQFEKYHQAKFPKVMQSVRDDGLYGWWSIELGRAVRTGAITADVCKNRLAEMKRYDSGEIDLPEWCNGSQSNDKTDRGDIADLFDQQQCGSG